MSQGPGRIERAIQTEIDREPLFGDQYGFVAVSAERILVALYRPTGEWLLEWKPTRSQRYAVTRAMRRFVERHPRYALTGGKGRMSLFLFDTTDARSVKWAALSSRPGAGHIPRSKCL
jgi:hypothetical protein